MMNRLEKKKKKNSTFCWVCVWGSSLPFPLPPLPYSPKNPHWLKAFSRGRAWKHAPGFSSFDWRKRRVQTTAAVQWLSGGTPVMFLRRFQILIKPQTRLSIIDWLRQDGVPETQGARGFHRLAPWTNDWQQANCFQNAKCLISQNYRVYPTVWVARQLSHCRSYLKYLATKTDY